MIGKDSFKESFHVTLAENDDQQKMSNRLEMNFPPNVTHTCLQLAEGKHASNQTFLLPDCF